MTEDDFLHLYVLATAEMGLGNPSRDKIWTHLWDLLGDSEHEVPEEVFRAAKILAKTSVEDMFRYLEQWREVSNE